MTEARRDAVMVTMMIEKGHGKGMRKPRKRGRENADEDDDCVAQHKLRRRRGDGVAFRKAARRRRRTQSTWAEITEEMA